MDPETRMLLRKMDIRLSASVTRTVVLEGEVRMLRRKTEELQRRIIANETARKRAERENRVENGEGGFAYMVALLLLVILTMLGLVLISVTEVGNLTASQERGREKTFRAAETGLAVAVARAASPRRELSPVTLRLPEPDAPQVNVVAVSPVVPLLDVPCNLCAINEAGQYYSAEHPQMRHLTYLVNSTATRQAGEIVTGRSTLSTHFSVEPQPGLVSDWVPASPEELARMRQ